MVSARIHGRLGMLPSSFPGLFMNCKNSVPSFQIVTRFFFFVCALAAGTVDAQPFSPASPFPGVHEHKTLPASTSATALVTSLNAEGALGFAYMYDSAFGGGISPPVSSLFVRNIARPKAHSYKTQPAPTTASALVTLLNSEGALGFRYFGDMTFDATLPSAYTVSLFTKDNSGAIYTYKQLTPASSEATFLAQVNAEGANGFAYVSDVAYPSGGGFLIASLFVKENSSAAVYSYESRPSAADVTAFLAQANAQGIRGFRYRGDLFVGSTLFSLFMKNSTAQYRFVFEARTPQATAAAYVTQSNAEGARGFVYAGDFAFGGFPTTISSFYVAAVGTLGDANGDGKSDLLLRNSSNGQIDGVLMNGYTATGSATFMAPGSGWTATHIADFNGDGKADILWRHTDGRVAAWLMNGLVSTGGAIFMSAGSGWTVTHTADLNGDGKADILWRHTDGRVAVWIMDGLGATSGAILLAAPNAWSITHVADLNGDGKADILLRNTDGTVATWLMNGTTITAGATLLAAPNAWSITHTADLNGDGKADILWRNTDGTVAAWLMNGISLTGSNTFMAAGSGWSITHMADLNGDGKADILWRNTDGSTATWIMNGLGSTGGASLIPAPNSWSVTYTGDLNGDGKTDLIWRHPDGRLAIWLMNGAAQTAGGLLAGPGVLEIVPQP
jgi:FG-GAP-like repeat